MAARSDGPAQAATAQRSRELDRHVYSSEGEKENDPYDALPPQPAHQPKAQPKGRPTVATVGLIASCVAHVLPPQITGC